MGHGRRRRRGVGARRVPGRRGVVRRAGAHSGGPAGGVAGRAGRKLGGGRRGDRRLETRVTGVGGATAGSGAAGAAPGRPAGPGSPAGTAVGRSGRSRPELRRRCASCAEGPVLLGQLRGREKSAASAWRWRRGQRPGNQATRPPRKGHADRQDQPGSADLGGPRRSARLFGR